MWLAALGGRLSYVVHRACGHTVVWKTIPPDLPLCNGDIVCYDCGQVLWCRAHDPWRAASPRDGHSPADHWGQSRQPPTSLFVGLQQLLRLSSECPSGPAGDDIRRATCELIEADSGAVRDDCHRRMLKAIARVQRRRARGQSRDDDPNELTVERLANALRRELGTE